MALEYVSMYSSSTRWAAGRTLIGDEAGGSLKSMISRSDDGGQQLVSIGDDMSVHLVRSGA
ncbi:hypothetical protein Scep_011236 [Stephania cephalantha]|uniref:Uncharacterized protein n=1 Tax=Stephania cephalantha TaxID=152367 RepID=A0AAP0P5N9_9MAGN